MVQNYDVGTGPVSFQSFKVSPDPPDYLGRANAALRSRGLSGSSPKIVKVGFPLIPIGYAAYMLWEQPQHWKLAAGVTLASSALLYSAMKS